MRNVLTGPLFEKYRSEVHIDSTNLAAILLIESFPLDKETTADWVRLLGLLSETHEPCDELQVCRGRPSLDISAPALECCSWQVITPCVSPRSGSCR